MVVGSVLWQSYWLSFFYGTHSFVWFLGSRAVQFAITSLVNAAVIFGLFNLIFVGGFFTTAYKFAKPFVAFIIACTILEYANQSEFLARRFPLATSRWEGSAKAPSSRGSQNI